MSSTNGNGVHLNGDRVPLSALLGPVGSIVVVCVEPGLAAAMRECGVPAADWSDDYGSIAEWAMRRDVVVVHAGRSQSVLTAARQAMREAVEYGYAIRSGSLDLADMGFIDGDPGAFEGWVECERALCKIGDASDLTAEIGRRAFNRGDGSATVEADPPPREPAKVTCIADVERKEVEWLWEQHVPLGMLTMLAGDPKIGKSFLTITLAAAVSRGTCDLLPGGGMAGSGSVVLLSAEDDPARTIRPRLEAAGAELSRIHVYEATIGQDGSEMHPNLRVDLETIEAVVSRIGDCKLIVIDPISAYLGGTDDHRNAELRGILSPLKAMAERLGIAIVLVSHLNKGGGANGKHRVQGSIAYIGACRANFLCIKDPDDQTGRRVLICDNGTNITGEIPTLAYTIEPGPDGPVLTFSADPVEMTANEALGKEAEQAGQRRGGEDRSKLEEAGDWLLEVLTGGPWPAKEIEAAAKNCGFPWRTVERAKKDKGIVSDRQGFGRDSVIWWRLPDASTQDGKSP